MKTLLCVALAALAVALPASGRPGATAASRLSLMPLPATALGSQVAGLGLSRDSGIVSNADAADNGSSKVTAATLRKLGRVTGYTLDYGGDTPLHGRLYEVETSVELYRSPAAASSGLAFWKKEDGDVSLLRKLGGRVSYSRFPVTLGAGSFGSYGTISFKGALPMRGSGVSFRVGAFVGETSVVGSDAGEARSLATKNASALRSRMLDVLAGRVTGPRTPLPAKPKAGPPPGGPDLAALALRPSDFVTAKVSKQGYTLDKDLEPVSEHERTMTPAGIFATLSQTVALFKDTTTAIVGMAALRYALTSKDGLRESGLNSGSSSYAPHTVAVHVADDSFASLGVLQQGKSPGVTIGYTVIRYGRVLVLTVVGAPLSTPLQSSLMTAVVRATAERASKGLHLPNVA